MPLDPPAPSTPPTDPHSSPPQAPRLPSPDYEPVWRHTFLAQFTNPADREAIQRFGGLLYVATLSAGYVGNRDRLVAADDLDAVADDLDAVADDLDALGAALREISEVPDHLVLGPEDHDNQPLLTQRPRATLRVSPRRQRIRRRGRSEDLEARARTRARTSARGA